MRVRLHERVLHGFVSVGRVSQVMKRDPHGAALMAAHEFGNPITSLDVASIGLQRLDC